MHLRRAVPAVIVLASAIACGEAAQNLAPRLALREAAQNTAQETKNTFIVSVVGEDADVLALFGEDRAPGAEEGLELLRKSRLRVSSDPGKADSTDDDRFAAVLDLGGLDDAVELRVVDQHLYVRADVPGLAEVLGFKTADLEEFAAGAAANGFGFVTDALAGRWLSLDFSALGDLSSGSDLPIEGLPALDELAGRSLMDAFAKTFGEDVAIKRLAKEDAGQRYALTVPIRRVYEQLLPAMGGLGLPGFEMAPSPSDVPDKSITADVWVKDDRIKRAELDLSQFADEPAGRVALRVDVAGLDSAISAPKGAVEVDPAEIFGQILAGFMGLDESGFS